MISTVIFGILTLIATSIYNFLSGKRLLLDIYHQFRLSGSDIRILDQRCFESHEKSDFFISLTSLPSRIGFIDLTIKSLLLQALPPKEIRIYLPAYSDRENKSYEIPEFLKGLKCVKIITVEKDWGPSTKFIPALQASSAEEKILVTDDDCCYPKTYLEDFQNWSAKIPDQILTGSGWNVPSDLIDRPTTLKSNVLRIAPTPLPGSRTNIPLKIDILQGYAGYLICKKWMSMNDLLDYSSAPPASRFVDDVWISAHTQVQKNIIPLRRFCYVPWGRQKHYKKTSLARINTNQDHGKRNNTILLKYFAERWRR